MKPEPGSISRDPRAQHDREHGPTDTAGSLEPELVHVGLDLGGSAIKAGAISADGRIVARRSVAVEPGKGTAAVLDDLAGLARELGATYRVGLGSPGIFDRERGVVLASPNLRFLEGVALRRELAARLSIPDDRVVLENDANCAALGEHWRGAGRGEPDFLMLTLGTGVGGGLILSGALYAGPGGMAGEAGHVVIEPTGPACGCGSRGCLETLASASAAHRRATAAGLPPGKPGDLELLAEIARRSPGPERDLLVDVGRDLGHGLAVFVTLLDLRLFVIGGGFGAALDVLDEGIRRGLRERSYGRRLDDVRWISAELGADAGWIGAARLTLSSPDR
ncbi:MAG: ROK family protein [Planctomycetota bacterium]